LGQWRSKGGKWGHAPWGAGFGGATAQFFAVIQNVFLNRNINQSMLKNAYFLGKKCKNRLSGWGLCPQTPALLLPPRYYNFVEFVSSVKCILFRSKKKQVTAANVLPLLLLHFCTYILI